MTRLILRRLLMGAVTVWIVSVIIFAGVEILPGDACTAFLEREGLGERLGRCREDLGLGRPAVLRYLDWAWGALRGDLGVSASGDESIASLVGARLRNSALLAACALAVGVPMAVIQGVIAGLRRDGPLDIGISTLAIVSMTIPEFVSATVLILVFSVWLGWIPGIVVAPADYPVSAFFPGIILPVAVLTLLMVAHILRMVRASVIEVLSSDYVQMAHLRGVPYRRIVWAHVLPNALLPAINVVALTVAWLLGGVVVVEVVFNYPGLGRMTIDAISDRDLPVVQAIALIVAAAYVGVNLAADLLTLVLNPRLRTHHARRA